VKVNLFNSVLETLNLLPILAKDIDRLQKYLKSLFLLPPTGECLKLLIGIKSVNRGLLFQVAVVGSSLGTTRPEATLSYLLLAESLIPKFKERNKLRNTNASMTPEAKESLKNSQRPTKASAEKPVHEYGHPPKSV